MNESHVIVVGSANIDYTMVVPRLPAPGETVLASDLQVLPGGKGMNQAVAAARLGAAVTFVGAVGDDQEGAFLVERMKTEGINVDRVLIDETRRTGLAMVSVLPEGENSIAVASGANESLLPDWTASSVRSLAGPGSVVVVQAEIPRCVVESVAHATEAAGARLLLNLAPYLDVPAEVLRLADPLVVNEVEAIALHGAPISGPADAQRAAEALVNTARSVVITMGAAGACWATASASGYVPSPLVNDVVDTTGAGDAFVGALSSVLAAGQSLAAAVGVAGLVGAFTVIRFGAQPSYPSREEMTELLAAYQA
jgi:ribokinase